MQSNGALGVGGLVLYVCFHERAKSTPPLDASQTNMARMKRFSIGVIDR